jgi:hypothetical protein
MRNLNFSAGAKKLEQTHHVSSSSLLHGILPKNTVSSQLINFNFDEFFTNYSPPQARKKNQKLSLQKQKSRCRRRGGRMGISTVPGGRGHAGE